MRALCQFDIEVDLEHQHVGRRLVAVAVTAAVAASVAITVAAADEIERLVAVQVRPEQHGVQPHLGGCVGGQEAATLAGPHGRTAASQWYLNDLVAGSECAAQPGAWRASPWRPA